MFDFDGPDILLNESESNENVADNPVFRTPINVSKNITERKFDNIRKNSHEQRIPHRKAVKRKFPGPAGLLPDKPRRSLNDSSVVFEEVEKNYNFKKAAIEKDADTELTQTPNTIFNEAPYQQMYKDFLLNDSNSPLNRITVDNVRKQALRNRTSVIGIKVPFLAVVIQEVDCVSSPEPVLVLRDRTGELRGALDLTVWKTFGQVLKSGAAVALQKVGVLCKKRQVFVVITMKNILTLYLPTDDGVVAQPVQETLRDELATAVTEWEKNSTTAVKSPQKGSTNSAPFFVTVSSSTNHAKHQKTGFSNLDWDSDFDDFNLNLEAEKTYDSANKESSPAAQNGSSNVEDNFPKLSQAESQIFDLTLSGIDILEDFDL